MNVESAARPAQAMLAAMWARLGLSLRPESSVLPRVEWPDEWL
jgi:hypothetical protein